MIQWKFEALQDLYTVRQFEFHPVKETAAFGTVHGELCSINLEDRVVKYVGHVGKTRKDKVIAMCWNRPNSNDSADDIVYTGTEMGRICMTNCGLEDPIVQELEDFGAYTCCANVNMDNTQMIVSGFSHSAAIYDLATGRIHRKLENIHTDNLNNCRFVHTDPQICLTTSYDGTVKKWDLRCPDTQPLYTITSPSKIITINIHQSDERFVIAGEKKQINQYALVDGRHVLQQQLPCTVTHTPTDPISMLFARDEEKLFCRAFYSASNEYIYSVTCGNRVDSHVYITNTNTGELVNTIYIPPVHATPQTATGQPADTYLPLTLRGHPRKDEAFAVLTLSTSSRYQHLIYAEPTLLPSSTRKDTGNTIADSSNLTTTTQRTVSLHHQLPPLIKTMADCTAWEKKLHEWSNTVSETKESLRQQEQMEYERMKAEMLCIVCQMEKKCMVLVPCGHVCMCKGCCNTLMYHNIGLGNNCPLCNKRIESTMKVYM